MSDTAETKGEVIRDTQVGTEGDDVPDRLQLTGEKGREPRPYEGEGTHRYETRMSDEEIEKGLGRDARRASQVLHQQQHEHEHGRAAHVDLVERPSEAEAKEKALGSPQASQQL